MRMFALASLPSRRVYLLNGERSCGGVGTSCCVRGHVGFLAFGELIQQSLSLGVEGFGDFDGEVVCVYTGHLCRYCLCMQESRAKALSTSAGMSLVVAVLSLGGCAEFEPERTATTEPVGSTETRVESESILEITEDATSVLMNAVGNGDSEFVRVSATPGGCQGCTYGLRVDSVVQPGDLVDRREGLTVVVDEASAPLLVGTTLDFRTQDDEQGFVFDRPGMADETDVGDE